MTTVPPLYMCNIGALTYDFDFLNTTILMAGKINPPPSGA
jgi:hypothetical protein